jgi:hypothetical protein
VDAPLARLSEIEILRAQLQVSDALTCPEETATLSPDGAALVARAKELPKGNGLDPSDWDDLRALLADIRDAQEAGDASELRELREVLLDMLFNLEEI